MIFRPAAKSRNAAALRDNVKLALRWDLGHDDVG